MAVNTGSDELHSSHIHRITTHCDVISQAEIKENYYERSGA